MGMAEGVLVIADVVVGVACVITRLQVWHLDFAIDWWRRQLAWIEDSELQRYCEWYGVGEEGAYADLDD